MSKERKRREALVYHAKPRPGKIEVVPTKRYSTQRDLALAYSPGVAVPCLEIEKNPEDVYKIEDQKLSEIFLNAYNNFNYSYPLSNIIRYPPYLFRLKNINTKGTLDKLILDPNIGGVFPTHDDKNVANYEFKNVDVGKDSKLLFNYSKFTRDPYQGDLEKIDLRIDGDPIQKSFYENLSRKFEGKYKNE